MKISKLFDTYGWIAIASLLICGLTGVFLVIPYDPVEAYLSVSAFVTSNPAASLTRNLHYWSAQLFLVFTILHFIEHFRNAESIVHSSGEPKRILRKGTWLRLILSIIVVFYVMLSGFILKDDADSRQAHLILTTLLSSIPLIGSFLSNALAGSGESLITLYLHHAATATIIIFIVVYEHVRSIRVKWSTFIITSIIVILLSILFRAPLAQSNELVMKGPWYFVGLQEMLHLTDPLVVVAFSALLLLLIYFAPFSTPKITKGIKITILVAGIAYTMMSIYGYFFRGPMYTQQFPWHEKYLTPTTLVRNRINLNRNLNLSLVQVAGGNEGCMSCHKGMKGLSDAHNPDLIGCYSCHGGDPFTLNADDAHKNMYKVPGNLSNASATCGGAGCHDDITERVEGSLMAGLGGMIAVDRWVFGETDLPDGYFHVNKLKGSPSDTHLKNLCAGCHLGMEKTTHGNAKWLDRGGGCNACHLTYNNDALASLEEMKRLVKQGNPSLTGIKTLSHPSIDLNITNDKCESCHSRSGRISMSFAGWHETALKTQPENAPVGQYRQLPDKRIFIKQPADVHHEAGMLCIDCHGSYEVMGDGKQHIHKEDAVKIQCKDCHPVSGSPQEDQHSDNQFTTARISETDRETQLIAWLRDWSKDDPAVILTSREGFPLVNTRIPNDACAKFGKATLIPAESKTVILSAPEYSAQHKKSQTAVAYLIRKSDNKSLPLKAASTQCTKGKAHDRLDCEACHTAWVPQCIGCHNTFEDKTMGFDMLTKKERKGTWVEFTGEKISELPVLGIKDASKNHDEQRIGIFTPGMIMTVELGGSTNFHRLYSPVSGHTTRKEVRSCESCHLDPLALGYGRGELTLEKDGSWKFHPLYALNKHDKLPEDAWTGFLSERKDLASTRLNMRPFNIREQKRILQAGACLTCHKDGTKVMELCLKDFDQALKKVTKSCLVPR